MNPVFVNVILNNQYEDEEENDENPQSNPNKINIHIVESIYDEIEKEIETKQISYIQVPIVDEKMFVNSFFCFFY